MAPGSGNSKSPARASALASSQVLAPRMNLRDASSYSSHSFIVTLGALSLLLVQWSSAADARSVKSSNGSSDQAQPRGSGFWSVRGTDFVDSNGKKVYFSGVVWAGFETPDAVVHGLWGRTIGSHLDQMKSLGFNMIRLPFAGDTLRKKQKPKTDIYGTNPQLKDLTSLQIMDKVIEGAGNRGMKVILDYHRLHLTISNELGTWFDDDTPESTWINNWVKLAKRYKGNPTVIGADLFNEVHPNSSFPKGAPFWVDNAGDNEKYNFRSASVRAIAAIQAVEPNWICFLEGVSQGYWWGGDVASVLKYPIKEPAGKIAYSPHEYGPSVYMQSWFKDPKFPSNLVPTWSKKWGLAVEKGQGALWVGEFGSFYPKATDSFSTVERTTFETLIGYIGQLKASWTIAFWNPNSKDTGGILNDDWNTVNKEKMKALQSIMYPNFNLK